MARVVSTKIEHFPVAGVFNIARGAKRHVDVVTVTISEDGHIGRGEATAIYYHHETAASVEAQVESIRAAIERGVTRSDLQRLLPRGAARNAVDSALWSLEARQSATPAWVLAGLAAPRPIITPYTLSLSAPPPMESTEERRGGETWGSTV